MYAYGLRIADRAVRTALQTVAAYLVVAHTLGDVPWRAVILAALLAVATTIVQAAADMPTISGLGAGGDILARAIRTAAHTLLGAGGTTLLFTEIPWQQAMGAAGLAAVASVVTSLVAMPMGAPSTRGTPELVGRTPALR
jgi:hypothetical protein